VPRYSLNYQYLLKGQFGISSTDKLDGTKLHRTLIYLFSFSFKFVDVLFLFFERIFVNVLNYIL
jgi:hypothetical protein